MTARMNWDRVRKETQARRSGVDWIGQDGTGPKPGLKSAQTPVKIRRTASVPAAGKIMARCTCKKTVGFIGEHKRKCPRWRSPTPTLEHFAAGVGKFDQRGLLANVLSTLRREAESDQNASEQDRKEAQKLIRSLEQELTFAATLESWENARNGVFSQAKLTELLRLRMPTYLRAENGVAVRVIESAAAELGLTLYRFQCSIRTKENDLLGIPVHKGGSQRNNIREAFAKGGLFCVESIEKAPFNFQFWLKGWLAATSVKPKIARHPDFCILITSPTSPRDLCMGRVDAAFLDSLSYLDMKSSGPSTTV